MDKVAYILVCWNNKEILKECIESIQKQDYLNKAIYIIDNASSDGSADYIKNEFPEILLTKSSSNNGFARGNNILIRKALKDSTIKYFALINTDARIDENWTSQLVKEAEKHQKVACLQSLTLDYYNHSLIDSHHVYLRPDFHAAQFGYKELVGEINVYTTEIQGVNAAAALITREFIVEQPEKKLFDESFFMYLEDVDVSLRAQIMGWHNYFVSGTRAYHMGSASSNKQSSSFSLYWTGRNQIPLLIKNVPLRILINRAPFFLKDRYYLIKHLQKNMPKGTASLYARGLILGFFRSFLYYKKRSKLFKLKSINSKTFWKTMVNGGFR